MDPVVTAAFFDELTKIAGAFRPTVLNPFNIGTAARGAESLAAAAKPALQTVSRRAATPAVRNPIWAAHAASGKTLPAAGKSVEDLLEARRWAPANKAMRTPQGPARMGIM